jgi:hypothetical protein
LRCFTKVADSGQTSEVAAFFWITLAAFVLCSAAWSVGSAVTLRGAVQYVFLILGSIGVAETSEPDDFMSLVEWLAFLSAVASLALLIVSPANAFGESGDFRGIFSQKNPLGQAMAIGVLASLHGIRVGKRSRFLSLSMLFVMLIAGSNLGQRRRFLQYFYFAGSLCRLGFGGGEG